MTPQIEKTYPAGVVSDGYRSDTSPLVTPLIGSALARPLTVIIKA
jgi:hypothetical protein